MDKQNRPTILIKMNPFLKAFFISVYGPEPVFIPKRDKFNDVLKLTLAKTPKDYKPVKVSDRVEYVEIIIPYFETLNINTYNYLSQNNQRAFENRVRSKFWVTFEDLMDECFRNDLSRIESISLFIEKYNLPDNIEVEDMLRKALYRSRRIFQKYPKRSYSKKK